MRKLGLLSFSVIVFGAFAALSAAQALATAQPEELPKATSERTWTGETESETVEFIMLESSEKLLRIKCTLAKDEGTEGTKGPEGTYVADFTGCKTGTTACNTLSDAEGVILESGSWRLRFDKPRTGTFELFTALQFTLNAMHIQCGGLILIEIRGTVACLVLKPTEKAVVRKYHCIKEEPQPDEIRQGDILCKEDNGTSCVEFNPREPKLECAINHGTFSECAKLELGFFQSSTKEELFIDT